MKLQAPVCSLLLFLTIWGACAGRETVPPDRLREMRVYEAAAAKDVVRQLLEQQFADVRGEVTASLTQQLGRSFSYDRLSPSVFRNLEIYGLEIDGPRGETLRIDRAQASYSLLAILTGDVQNVVDRLIIRQAFLEIDFTRDREFIENVRETLFGRGLFPQDLVISLREVEIPGDRDPFHDEHWRRGATAGPGYLR